ncbi:MAG: hypothetical protein ACYDDC_06115 [Thermoplasmataceae archaeon]
MSHQCFNSPYGVEEYGDVRIHDGSMPSHSRDYISQRNGRSICQGCFYGLHPHDPRLKEKEVGGFKDIQDCKVILTDREGQTIGQCSCTWYREGGKHE